MEKFKKDNLEFTLLDISVKEAKELVKNTLDQKDNRISKLGIEKKKVDRLKAIFNHKIFSLFNDANATQSFVRDPIIFNVDGTIYEGRHRMVSFSKLEDEMITIKFFVILGFGEKYKKMWHDYHEDEMRRKGRR